MWGACYCVVRRANSSSPPLVRAGVGVPGSYDLKARRGWLRPLIDADSAGLKDERPGFNLAQRRTQTGHVGHIPVAPQVIHDHEACAAEAGFDGLGLRLVPATPDERRHDCIGDTLKPLALRAHKKGLELAYEVRPDVPNLLIGDPGRLRQILINLIGNAIKFTSQGEIAVRVALEEQVGGEEPVACAVAAGRGREARRGVRRL